MTSETKPECACGDTSVITGGEKRIIFPCAGVANVGQISNLAAFQLTDEGYGIATCIALLATGDPALKCRLLEADEVVIPDGCPVTCGIKIAAAQGITPDQHIVITGPWTWSRSGLSAMMKPPSKNYTGNGCRHSTRT